MYYIIYGILIILENVETQRVLAVPKVIAHIIGFSGDPENVDVVLRPARYAHFFL